MLIVPHNPEWAKHFEQIKKKLSDYLDGIHINIEHIGGTAIKGLSAKPIIDLDIIHYHANEFEKIKIVLESAGYYHNGNQGIVGREVFKRNKINHDDILDEITHHLYVCLFDSEELEKQLLFRDYLKANDNLRIAYQNLKYEIANEADNDKKNMLLSKKLKQRHLLIM